MPIPLPARLLLVGLAAGGRTTAAPTALTWTSRAGDAWPAGLLDRQAARIASAVATLGEVVIDKLPQTPSRLMPPALAGRLAVGAAAGVALAVRDAGVSARRLPVTALLPAIALGAGGAFAGAQLGAAWRGRNPLPSDVSAALVEDTAVIVLSWAAVGR